MCATVLKLNCPKCNRGPRVIEWQDAHAGDCPKCRTHFELIAFPALTAAEAGDKTVGLQAADTEACCFFHRENKAEQVCGGCGRYLCSVCAVPFGQRTLCPSCIEKEQVKEGPKVVSSRVLWDSIALTLAAVPILLWPISCLTAPVALGMAIVGWKKPCSLVGGRRIRLVSAMVISLLQIAFWIFLVTTLVLAKSKHR